MNEQTTETGGLVVEHIYLVQHVVNQLASRYPRHVDRAELWSAGAYGLVDAARRYDERTGIPFARYASIRIRGAIIDSTRTRDWATRSLRRRMRGVQSASERFEEHEGREPSTVELAAALGISVAELAEHQSAAYAATVLHLDQVTGANDTDVLLADTVCERTSEWLPEEAAEQRELLGTIRTAVRFLPDVQREVIERYYFHDELLRDIAADLGVTEARTSQIRSEALAAMRSYFSTGYDGVPTVDPKAPGSRQRIAYVAAVSARTTWRSRLDAADEVEGVAAQESVSA